MILPTHGEEREKQQSKQYLEDRAVETSEVIICNTKCISQTTTIIPDILQTISLGMLKNLMNWETFFLEQHSRIDKFNEFWVMMRPSPGFAPFNTPYSQVTPSSGEEMKAVGHVIVQVVAAPRFNLSVRQRIPFTEPLLFVKNLVDVHLLAQYRYHTEATIEYIENYLEEFHCHKDVVSQPRSQ